MERINSLNSHFRRTFGGRARKVPLDAGFSCPNRDGTLSRAGCAFCNPAGSGTGAAARGLSLRAQWDELTPRLARRYGTPAFVAYLQAFSNTHGPLDRVAAVLSEIAALPGVAGLCLGTRPDCLDGEKLDLLASFPAREVWLELGLQSASDATLARVNRGHDAAAFAHAATAAAARGIKVCAHVMAGLPGESGADFLATVEFVNALPVAGIKFHNLYLCAGSALAGQHAREHLALLTREEYVGLVAAALPRLRADVVVHRLAAEPAPGELVGPDWALDKAGVARDILAALEAADSRQGKECDRPARPDPASVPKALP